MSLMPARMRSVEEARGMVTLVGNHEIVSQMRVARVSQIQQQYDSRAGPRYQHQQHGVTRKCDWPAFRARGHGYQGEQLVFG